VRHIQRPHRRLQQPGAREWRQRSGRRQGAAGCVGIAEQGRLGSGAALPGQHGQVPLDRAAACLLQVDPAPSAVSGQQVAGVRVAVQHERWARHGQLGQDPPMPRSQRVESRRVKDVVAFQRGQAVTDQIPYWRQVAEFGAAARDGMVQPGQGCARLGRCGPRRGWRHVIPQRDGQPVLPVRAGQHRRGRRDCRASAGRRVSGHGHLTGQPGRGFLPALGSQRCHPGHHRCRCQPDHQIPAVRQHTGLRGRQPDLAG
jgi:hypothetical protein